MAKLTPKQRQFLKAKAHTLKPLIQIGKAGATPALMEELDRVLGVHELVKVKLEAECPDDRYAVADQLGEQPGVNVVQILGRTILLYKRHPQEPRFEGKRAAETAVAAPAKSRAPAKRPPKRRS